MFLYKKHLKYLKSINLRFPVCIEAEKAKLVNYRRDNRKIPESLFDASPL